MRGWFPANFMAWDLSLSTKNRSMCYCSYFAEDSRSVTLILDAVHATVSTLSCMIKGMVHDSCSPRVLSDAVITSTVQHNIVCTGYINTPLPQV